ncbi:hypothetical protein DENSPDRAFT_830731 [Dentipellis sp. KUC8613]|nr:hypothetical protein DENSPDRAFT_830731 [Dentipellis sp. KUC8613]
MAAAVLVAPPPTLAEEEALDLADPLRHLRDEADGVLIPSQPHSVQNEITELKFALSGSDGNQRAGEHGPAPSSVAIKLVVDASPGCGGIAWPAGEVLAAYLARRKSLAGTNVVELGSGTGLVGLVAAQLGARVWITDQAPLLPIMQRNIDFNNLSTTVIATELNWGSALPACMPRPQLILAADCVYFEPAFPLLVQTLSDLVPAGSPESEDPEILFCYKKRRKADKRFFTLLKKHFTWTDIEDNPDRAEYTRDAISLLRLHRRR